MTKVISLFWTIFDKLAANQFTRWLVTDLPTPDKGKSGDP